MAKHTAPRHKDDDTGYPVRVKVQNGYDQPLLPWTEITAWLTEHVGRGHYAQHNSGLYAVAFYFRSIEIAQAFIRAFPMLQLADTTDQIQSIRESRNWAASGQVWQHHSG